MQDLGKGNEHPALILPSPTTSDYDSAAKSVFDRRILKNRDYLGRISKKLARSPAYTISYSYEHFVLMVHPADETPLFSKYKAAFGDPFPSLFSVNRQPQGLLPFVGSVETKHDHGPHFIGSQGFKSRILTDCFFDLRPDTTVSIELLKLVGQAEVRPRIDYNIFLCFLMGFGKKYRPQFVEGHLDDFVVRVLAYANQERQQ